MPKEHSSDQHDVWEKGNAIGQSSSHAYQAIHGDAAHRVHHAKELSRLMRENSLTAEDVALTSQDVLDLLDGKDISAKYSRSSGDATPAMRKQLNELFGSSWTPHSTGNIRGGGH